MKKETWLSESQSNIWKNEQGDQWYLYWKNINGTAQHSVLIGGSRGYLVKLIELAANGFNPDVNIEYIESFQDGDMEGELVKRKLVKA